MNIVEMLENITVMLANKLVMHYLRHVHMENMLVTLDCMLEMFDLFNREDKKILE